MPETRRWTPLVSVALLAIVVAIVLVGLLPKPSLADAPRARLAAWLGIMGLLLLFAIVAGKGVSGFWRGMLIDENNRISLARFQLALWTTLILSAYLEAALSNLRLAAEEAPLDIAIPGEVWGLLGIATASLVGSPLILSSKATREPDPSGEKETKQALAEQKGVPRRDIRTRGQVVAYASPDQATWGDMFRGDETANGATLDLAKVQMFFFTIVLILAYGVAVANRFLSTEEAKIVSLPLFDAGMVGLLGISHGGYLLNKAVPRSDPTA